MTLVEGCVSLKLECALRELGFVEIGWRVIAHAGLFFVSPVGFTGCLNKRDDLLGFQISESKPVYNELNAGSRILPSAKRAIEVAFELSP